jgi:hypothetical protein
MGLIKNIFSKLFLTLPAILVGCSGSTEDVRLTLCKDLAAELLDAPKAFDVISEDIVISGYEDLQVRLKYQAESGEGTAVCFYRYNAVEENAMTVSDPASAFATYPSKVLLDGEVVDQALVASKVNKVLLKQGKQVIDAVKNVDKK